MLKKKNKQIKIKNLKPKYLHLKIENMKTYYMYLFLGSMSCTFKHPTFKHPGLILTTKCIIGIQTIFYPYLSFFSLSTADIKGCEFFFNIEIGRKKPFSKQNFFEFTHKANIKSFCLMKYKSLVFFKLYIKQIFR